MIKDLNGQIVNVGDEITDDNGRSAIVTGAPRMDYGVSTAEVDAPFRRALNLEKFWTVTKRADGSSPSADPRPVIGKDRDGRDVRKGDRVRASLSGYEMIVESFIATTGQFTGESDCGLSWTPHQSNVYVVTDAAPTEPAPPPSGRAVSVLTDQMARAFPAQPLTFPTCPACGERMPGAECGQPACAQVRKWAAMRKAETASRERIGKLDEAVRVAVARYPGLTVTTDPVGAGHHAGPGLLVELRSGNARREFLLGERTSATDAMLAVDDDAESIVRELGKRVVGGGR